MDCMIKNCGNSWLLEISSREFYGNLTQLSNDSNTDVMNAALELIQSCGVAFKNKPELYYPVQIYESMKKEGSWF
jgi:VHS domain